MGMAKKGTEMSLQDEYSWAQKKTLLNKWMNRWEIETSKQHIERKS